jgi:hypothetical protein
MSVTEPPAPLAPPSPGEVTEACAAIAADVAEWGDPRTRDDATAAIHEATGRIEDGAAEVIVVGETKAGKSSLVNSLSEWPGLLPVDADVATNVHITVHYAQAPEARAYLAGTEDPVEIGLDDIEAFAAIDKETGKPSRDDVRYVTAGVPSALLESGLTLVDTPGVGGLLAGHTHITKAMLRRADALMFVTSAEAELTKSALAFLAGATERIATVFFVLTQVDLHRGWQRVLERNRELLAKHAQRYVPAPWFAVSNRAELARLDALRQGDLDLARSRAELSGCAPLRDTLISAVASHGLELRMRNALHLARHEGGALTSIYQRRVRMLSLDPMLAAELELRKTRLKRLVDDDAQWRTELVKGMHDLERDLKLELQRSINDIRSMAEMKIALSEQAADLSQIPADMEAAVTGATMDLGLSADAALARILGQVRAKIGEVDLETSLSLPSRLKQLPGLVETTHDSKGVLGTVERLAPAVGLGTLAGTVMAWVTGGVLLPVLAGVGVMVTLSERRKKREALLRGRADATRYVNRVLSEVSTELPPQIAIMAEQAGSTLRAAIAGHVRQRRRDLEAEIAEQQSYLDAARDQLALDRAEAQLLLDRFRKHEDRAAMLESQLGPIPGNG